MEEEFPGIKTTRVNPLVEPPLSLEEFNLMSEDVQWIEDSENTAICMLKQDELEKLVENQKYSPFISKMSKDNRINQRLLKNQTEPTHTNNHHNNETTH